MKREIFQTMCQHTNKNFLAKQINGFAFVHHRMELKMQKLVFCFVGFFSSAVMIFAQPKPDALKYYFNGRDLDAKGRTEDAVTSYNTAINICLNELAENPNNMDSYAVYTWSLYRLKKYAETVAVCTQALNIREDARIVETMGEALFYLNRFDECLEKMQRYIELPHSDNRIGAAYFFEAEIYRLRKQYNKAEIAYTTAVYFEPSLSHWWLRLGNVREAVDNKAGALEAYNRALNLNPNQSEATNAIKRLSN